jgi:DnaJ-domain-containing protein 1
MTDERDNPLARAAQQLSEMQGEMYRRLGSIMEDILNPSILQGFMEFMGSGMPQPPNMGSQQTGFDAYWLLGLEKSASDEEVRKRYRALLHRLHPDTAGVEGTERLLSLVIAAYGQIAKERRWE